MNMPKKMSHEAMPRRPVVTAKVGRRPTPYEKSVFQKIVLLTSAGLYESHCSTNEFGPEPKSGLVLNVFLAISYVTESDGRTSRLLTESLLAMLLPKELPQKMKM